MKYSKQNNKQSFKAYVFYAFFIIIYIFSVGAATAAVMPLNESSMDYARMNLKWLNFSLNVSPDIVYKSEMLSVAISAENLTTYTTYFVSSDHFIIDENKNKTQIARYGGAIGGYSIFTDDFPDIFNKNGTYTLMVVYHRENHSDIVNNISFYYYHHRRPCTFDPDRPVVSMSLINGFSLHLRIIEIYNDGAVKSVERDFLTPDGFPDLIVKSGRISEVEVQDMLDFMKEKGFAEMNKSYEQEGVYDETSGRITVNSEDVCNSVKEYPVFYNPYAPTALHDIENKIIGIERNATMSLSSNILLMEVYPNASVFKKGTPIDFIIKIKNIGNETSNITNPDMRAGSIIAEVRHEKDMRYFNKDLEFLTPSTEIIELEPNDTFEIPLDISEWQPGGDYKISSHLKNNTGDYTIKVIYTSFNTGKNVWFGQIESDKTKFRIVNETFIPKSQNQIRDIPTLPGIYIVICIYIINLILKRK